MKVIVTGATGMVGKGVLIECLESEEITVVLSIGRRSLEMEHPKLKELIHKDFSEFASVSDELKGYDACYACMGVSSAGMKEEQYKRMTYDFTMALAKELYALNPKMNFIYVSGEGTDSTEKGRIMWARIKGKTENDIMALGFDKAFAFRPGAIIPEKGVHPSSKLYSVLISTLKWLLYLIKAIAPQKVVGSSQIGQAMINTTKYGYDKKVIAPEDIQKLAAL